MSAIGGRRKKRKLIVGRGSLDSIFAGEPSFASAIRLDGGAHRWRHVIAALVAMGAHGGIALAVLAQHVEGDRAAKQPHREVAASIVRPKTPPQFPQTPPPPRTPRPEARAPRSTQHSAPPPPAQAGRAIAVEGPADLTSFDLVVGSGTSYAGGRSTNAGTNREAVHAESLGNGPPRSAEPDLSRAPSLLDRDWSCAWPEDALDSDLRDARVTLRVHVGTDGAAEQIEVIASPSNDFAEAARRCAEGARYRSALDRSGAPIEASTPLFNVHFLR